MDLKHVLFVPQIDSHISHWFGDNTRNISLICGKTGEISDSLASDFYIPNWASKCESSYFKAQPLIHVCLWILLGANVAEFQDIAPEVHSFTIGCHRPELINIILLLYPAACFIRTYSVLTKIHVFRYRIIYQVFLVISGYLLLWWRGRL